VWQTVKVGTQRISTLTKLRNGRKALKIKLYFKDRMQINREKIKKKNKTLFQRQNANKQREN